MPEIKVLLVDDSRHFHQEFESELIAWQAASSLQDPVRLLSAHSIAGAKKIFQMHHSDLAIIIVDACLGGSVPNTQPLVKWMRQSYFGNMLAISSVFENCNTLVEAGYDCGVTKEYLIYPVTRIIEKQLANLR